jgi:predicted esterase YcpF (UPF0227 family)
MSNEAGSHHASKYNCRKVVMLKAYYATVEIDGDHALCEMCRYLQRLYCKL